MITNSEATPLKADIEHQDSRSIFHGRRFLLFINIGALLCFIGISVSRNPSSPDDTLEYKGNWMPDLGNYSMPITFDGPAFVQELFNTGLMECYGFAFTEARTMARKAIALSSLDNNCNCPMCYWLLAMSYSPFINHPLSDTTSYQKGGEAADKALVEASKRQTLPKKEQGLIDAMSARFSSSVKDQKVGYIAYRDKLKNLHDDLPDDQDIMAFYADSIMVIHCDKDGYHFYEDDKITPKLGIPEAIEVLRKCLTISDHALCEHLYIHITEPSMKPYRAEVAADHLLSGVRSTQAQHLQHMPSHTYLRIGRYHDATIANIQAHVSDEAYIDHGLLPYGPAHDTAFLVHAAQTSGEKWVAYQYADSLRKHYRDFPDQPDYPDPELGWHIWRTVRLRFGDFDKVLLDSDDTPRDWPYTNVLGDYTKGVALLLSKPTDISAAVNYLVSLQSALQNLDDSFKGVATVANLTLASAIAYWKGDMESSLSLVQAARKEQESWMYTEPPGWYMTVAQCEGTLLRIMNQTESAMDVFQHDLMNIPENRHSLYGLWKTMVVSGEDDAAILPIKRRYEMASSWANPSAQPLVCPHLGE